MGHYYEKTEKPTEHVELQQSFSHEGNGWRAGLEPGSSLPQVISEAERRAGNEYRLPLHFLYVNAEDEKIAHARAAFMQCILNDAGFLEILRSGDSERLQKSFSKIESVLQEIGESPDVVARILKGKARDYTKGMG